MAKMCGCGGSCGYGPCPRAPRPQEHVGLDDQLRSLRALAQRRGYLEAADVIGSHLGEPERPA